MTRRDSKRLKQISVSDMHVSVLAGILELVECPCKNAGKRDRLSVNGTRLILRALGLSLIHLKVISDALLGHFPELHRASPVTFKDKAALENVFVSRDTHGSVSKRYAVSSSPQQKPGASFLHTRKRLLLPVFHEAVMTRKCD
jgi:hypothetical protein